MFRAALFGLFALFAFAAPAAAQEERRLVFVMLDGLRWQEVYRGADPVLAADADYMRSSFAKDVRARFVDVADRRAALMPFLASVVAREGVMIGDRDKGSCARVTNDRWFSYPGYNEVLTGKPDPRVNSNDYGPNPNVTFLEWLNRRPDFSGRVMAATSWDAFGRIINAERSGVRVDAGMAPLAGGDATAAAYNRLMADTPALWKGVRHDGFTHMAAMHLLTTASPRALFVSYDETDDFAHDGDYAQYLLAAHRTDRFLREIWEAAQRDGQTTLIVTVDHGRGDQPGESWRHHYSGPAIQAGSSPLKERFPNGIPGSDQTWIAAIGPQVRAGATVTGACAGSNQIAATALRALDLNWRDFDRGAGAPLDIFRR